MDTSNSKTLYLTFLFICAVGLMTGAMHNNHWVIGIAVLAAVYVGACLYQLRVRRMRQRARAEARASASISINTSTPSK